MIMWLKEQWAVLSVANVPLIPVLIGIGGIIAINVFRPRKTTRGNRGMSEHDERLRREKKRAAVSDAFGDALLDLWAEDIISKDDYNYYCLRLGKDFGFSDLLRRPPKLHPAALRRRLELLKDKLQQKRSFNGKGTEPEVKPPSGSLSERLRLIAHK